MNATSITIHDVTHIVIKSGLLEAGAHYAEIHFINEGGHEFEITALSATDSAIPIEGATLTDEVPA